MRISSVFFKAPFIYDRAYNWWDPINTDLSRGNCTDFGLKDQHSNLNCGYYEVPMDYSDSSTGKVRLAVITSRSFLGMRPQYWSSIRAVGHTALAQFSTCTQTILSNFLLNSEVGDTVQFSFTVG